MEQKISKTKLKAKQQALNYLQKMDELAAEHKRLDKVKNIRKENANIFQKINIQLTYNAKRDSVDRQIDAIYEKYIKLLKRHKDYKPADYLKYVNGLLDKRFVDDVFNSKDKNAS